MCFSVIHGRKVAKGSMKKIASFVVGILMVCLLSGWDLFGPSEQEKKNCREILSKPEPVFNCEQHLNEQKARRYSDGSGPLEQSCEQAANSYGPSVVYRGCLMTCASGKCK